MKIYAVRECWDYEIYDLVHFSRTREGCEKWIQDRMAKDKWDLYFFTITIEEWDLHD